MLRYRHMFKTAFLQKNVYYFETVRQNFLFSKKASELSSLISTCLKSIVTVEVAAQIAGQI